MTEEEITKMYIMINQVMGLLLKHLKTLNMLIILLLIMMLKIGLIKILRIKGRSEA